MSPPAAQNSTRPLIVGVALAVTAASLCAAAFFLLGDPKPAAAPTSVAEAAPAAPAPDTLPASTVGSSPVAPEAVAAAASSVPSEAPSDAPPREPGKPAEGELHLQVRSEVAVSQGAVNDVDKTMKGTRLKLRDCMQKAISGADAAKGKLTVRLELGESGAVKNVNATTDRGLSPSATRCADEVFKGLRFDLPRTEKGAIVTASYSVAPRDESRALMGRGAGRAFRGVRLGPSQGQGARPSLGRDER